MVAAVIIISFFIALLVFVVIVSLKQQGWVLNEMVRINQALAVATTHLEEEKARMDVMLVRQFNLIECFSNTNQANLDASSLAVANSSESSSTAQRIAGEDLPHFSLTSHALPGPFGSWPQSVFVRHFCRHFIISLFGPSSPLLSSPLVPLYSCQATAQLRQCEGLGRN